MQVGVGRGWTDVISNETCSSSRRLSSEAMYGSGETRACDGWTWSILKTIIMEHCDDTGMKHGNDNRPGAL